MKRTDRRYLKIGFGFMMIWAMAIMGLACGLDADFENPDLCETSWTATCSFEEIKSLYAGRTLRIQEDCIIEGYIVSSDKGGNFYSSIHIQNRPDNPTEGLELLVDMRDTHLFLPLGSKIFFNTKGLYLGKSKGSFQIGGTYTLFGEQIIGRIPGNLLKRHILLDCSSDSEIYPKAIRLETLAQEKASTLVFLDSLQFSESEEGMEFSEAGLQTRRQLEDCIGNTIFLETSGFSDFSSQVLPTGNGSLTGVLNSRSDGFSLVIRSLEDIQMNNDRCDKGPDPMTSDQILISEIADPDNNNSARFIELYNSGEGFLDLKGWSLERYTNGNLELGSTIDLTGIEMASKQAIVIASDEAVFQEVYGFAPIMEGGSNSAADSNGDDNILLRDPFGKVVDIFGRIGEDGSNTDHEFEDGRASRIKEISMGNPVYDPAEWLLFNDTGGMGSIKQPQIAPGDFTPGVH